MASANNGAVGMAAGAPVPSTMQRGGGSGPRVLVAWLLLAEYLQFDLRRWALFLLLSVLTAAAHVTTSLDGRPVPVHSWALDAVSVVAAVVLLCAVLLGGREEGGSIAEEPLLNDVHEMADENNRSAVRRPSSPGRASSACSPSRGWGPARRQP
ncbi:hypothetical protein SETIT_9G191000v2 [Setaria italica]|uniref:Uncharacterized protein n=1 Tax=Setaria italica TaxID=4555 RepID=A0A368SI74_SETIT|nr:hypothetical protein SETIT_9G191000v2 [Setaria italica]